MIETSSRRTDNDYDDYDDDGDFDDGVGGGGGDYGDDGGVGGGGGGCGGNAGLDGVSLGTTMSLAFAIVMAINKMPTTTMAAMRRRRLKRLRCQSLTSRKNRKISMMKATFQMQHVS